VRIVRVPVGPVTLSRNDRWLPVEIHFATSADSAAGVQSSSATFTRMSMSPVMSSAAASGVLR